MQTLVKMLDDVYPHGCLGDVVAVDEAALKELKAVAKVRKHEVYDVVNGAAQVTDDTDAAAKAKAEEARAAKQAEADQKAKDAADKKAADDAAAKAKAEAGK